MLEQPPTHAPESETTSSCFPKYAPVRHVPRCQSLASTHTPEGLLEQRRKKIPVLELCKDAPDLGVPVYAGTDSVSKLYP